MTPRRRRRTLTAVLVAAAFLAALPVAAWAVVERNADRVAYNVELGGQDVGGMSATRLERSVDEVAADYEQAPIEVRTPKGTLRTTASDLGLVVDRIGSRRAARLVGREGSVLERPLGWLRSFITSRTSPVVATVDPMRVAYTVVAGDPTGRREPVEPKLLSDGAELRIEPGVPGSGLSPDEVAEAVVEATEDADGQFPIVVDARARPIPTQVSEAAAGEFLQQAERLTAGSIQVSAGGGTATLEPGTSRAWLRSIVRGDRLRLRFDRERALEDLRVLLDGVGQPAVSARFDVQGGQPVIVPGQPGSKCCAPEAAPIVIDTLRRRASTSPELPLEPLEAELSTEEAEGLGIVQQVSLFTTNHAAGESRVTNIHRIADLIRGQVIEPGETFSVNDFVGPRTRENGFVDGGVIQEGVFTTSVGGGISQFATTLFNAAFYAGLDFGSYQSHSIPISRYPYGVEATLSFPEPDLEVQNTTDNGVLIWPTYTDSSITVTLYSTPSATVELGPQTREPSGNCTRVTTERVRIYPDGDRDIDEVYATYRPAEGVDC